MNKELLEADNKTLRNFGLLVGVVFPVFFSLLIPWIYDLDRSLIPLWIGIALIVSGLLIPRILITLYVPWMILGGILGWINTRIILSAIFYIMFTPFAVVLKLLGKDILSLKIDKKTNSYRFVRENSRGNKHMESPF